MTFTPMARGIQIVVKAKQWGEDRQTVLHAQAAAAPTSAEVDSAAATVASWIGTTDTRNNFNGSITFLSVQATDVSVAGGYQTVVPLATLVGLFNAGKAVPGNVACAVSFHTSHGGRSGRGRVFMYGLTSDMLSDTEPDMVKASTAAAYFEAWQQLRDDMNTNGTPLSVGSRKDNAVYPIIAVTVDPSTDSMRRRLHGRGS